MATTEVMGAGAGAEAPGVSSFCTEGLCLPLQAPNIRQNATTAAGLIAQMILVTGFLHLN
jgi:hypothetical protein